MELKRDDIIKALECCSKHLVRCKDCPYQEVPRCTDEHQKDALSLIKELTEENGNLRASTIDYRNIPYIVADTRADTVRKMHFEIKERCIKGGIYPAFVASTIDQIAKEMLGSAPAGNETCVRCGDVIPEGREVCPKCEEVNNEG